MKNADRIPACKDYTFDGMLYWFAEMSVNDMLFHPDDDPSKLTLIPNNQPMFNAVEVRELRKTLDRMFTENGDDVYEAAYPIFMKRMGIQLDA